MASKEHDNNCINCRRRRNKLSDPDCIKCQANIKTMQQFPGWEPEEGSDEVPKL